MGGFVSTRDDANQPYWQSLIDVMESKREQGGLFPRWAAAKLKELEISEDHIPIVIARLEAFVLKLDDGSPLTSEIHRTIFAMRERKDSRAS